MLPNSNNKREVTIDRSNGLHESFQDFTKWKQNSSQLLSRAGEMAQWGKGACYQVCVQSAPQTHTVEREYQLLQVVL